MTSTVLAELFWVVVVPFAAAALAMLLARRLSLRPRAAWAASVAVGYVVGQFGLIGRAGIPTVMAAIASPHEARDWLPWAVLLAAGTTIWVVHATDSWRWVGHVLAVVIALAAPARLLNGSVWFLFKWTPSEKIFYLVLLAGAIGLVWWLLEAAKDDDQPLVRALLLILVALGTAVVVTLSGSFSYGELCGLVAAALIGGLVTGPPRRTSPNGLGGAAGAVTMSLGGLILIGFFYTELTVGNAVLLALALVAAGGRLPTASGIGPGLRAAVRIAICLVPLLIAVVQAYTARMADAANAYGGLGS